MDILKQLIKARKEKKIFQSEIGEAIGSGQVQISRIENGKQQITLKEAQRWAEYLELDLKLTIK